MARLLVGNQWYEWVNSRSWFERDFEQVVIDRAPQLFPSWNCVPFRETVEAEDGTRKQADLALIDPHYREWWVVEVELAHHDLRGHVLPQVDAFRTGRYDARHAAAIHRAMPQMQLDRLETMMLGTQPGVLVLVDSATTAWRPVLLEHGVGLAIVEPFRDAGNAMILRLNGDQPNPPAEILTRCTRHILRRLWRVHSPAALPSTDDQVLHIEFEGVASEWRRVDLQNAVMLQAARGDILADLSAVDIVRRDDGGLAFVGVTPFRRRSK